MKNDRMVPLPVRGGGNGALGGSGRRDRPCRAVEADPGLCAGPAGRPSGLCAGSGPYQPVLPGAGAGKAEQFLPGLLCRGGGSVLFLRRRPGTSGRPGEAAPEPEVPVRLQPQVHVRPAGGYGRHEEVQHLLHLQALQPEDPGGGTHRQAGGLSAHRPGE